MIIEQVEVQKKGGPCARYPVSCIVRDLIGAANLFKPLTPINILDLTYGQGVFYYAIRSRVRVAGVDPRRLEWVVRPTCFIKSYAQKWKEWLDRVLECLGDIDLVVVDPPWAQWKHKGSRKARQYYIAPVSLAIDIIEKALEVKEYLGVPVLIHYKERIDRGDIVVEVYFRGRSRYIREPRTSWFGILA